jgi:hypothetical protein
MAYIGAEDVKKIRDKIKAAYPTYKWSVTKRHSMEVNVALMESDLTFNEGHIQVNHYWYKESDQYSVKAKVVFQHVLEIINEVKLNYDRNAGDPGADYGDSNYFISLEVGKWDKHHKTVFNYKKEMSLVQMKQYGAECAKNREMIVI